MTDLMEAGVGIEPASTALQAAGETNNNPTLRALSNSHLPRFRWRFFGVLGLYIPILIALSGCAQSTCEYYPVGPWCFLDASGKPKYQRAKPSPTPRLRNSVKAKSNPVG